MMLGSWIHLIFFCLLNTHLVRYMFDMKVQSGAYLALIIISHAWYVYFEWVYDVFLADCGCVPCIAFVSRISYLLSLVCVFALSVLFFLYLFVCSFHWCFMPFINISSLTSPSSLFRLFWIAFYYHSLPHLMLHIHFVSIVSRYLSCVYVIFLYNMVIVRNTQTCLIHFFFFPLHIYV